MKPKPIIIQGMPFVERRPTPSLYSPPFLKNKVILSYCTGLMHVDRCLHAPAVFERSSMKVMNKFYLALIQ